MEHKGGVDVSAVNGEPGTRLRVAHGAVKFNARHCWHYTEEWQGKRVILVAFTIRHVESLSSEHRQFLLDCGVPVPECAPEETVIAPAEECFAAPSQAQLVPPLPGPKLGLGPGVPSSPLKPATALFLEIKCGSGSLSARVRREGFQVLALDRARPKGRVHVHLVPVDIASASGFAYLTKVVQHDSPFHVHFFPSTKSCFNPSYESERTLQVVELLQASEVNYSVFHPEKSFLWSRLRPQQGSRDLRICAGCYGAACPVKMRLHTNLSALSGMPEPSCHCKFTQHASGALAADALYTTKFCDHFAGLMQLAVGNAGLLLQEVRPLQCSSHAAVAAAGKQPRLSKFRPQIEEFKCQATLRSFPWPLQLDYKGNLKSPIGPVPAGSRLLRVVCESGVVGAKKTDSLSQAPTAVTFGIYRTESEFVAQALHLEHPFDLCVAVPDFMLRALAFNLKEGPVGVMKHRIALLQKWSSWKRDLLDEENRLHASMEPGVAAVMRGKHILLLEKIAASFGWPDMDVFKCLKNGFPLVGESQPSGIFDVDRKPASLTREELLQHSKFLRPALWAKVSSTPLDDTAKCIWEATQQELIEKEWLAGPFSWDQLQARYPEGWLPVRRFGLVQKDKTRSIDDLAENSVNQAYAVSDRISLRALDELVWMAITIFKVLASKGEVSIPLADGGLLRFHVHPFWRSISMKDLQPCIKTVDLKSAYKQLAIEPADRCLGVVSVRDPISGSAFGFESRTLVFGATSSVTSFNRVARLVQRVLLELQIISCNYFDDYPVLELLPLCNSAQKSIRLVLGLLGFVWAEDKDKPFAPEAELLGVRVDLGDSEMVKIRNKPERAESIAAAVDTVLSSGFLDPKILPTLFGRIQFAEGQLHGRLGRLALSDLRACTMSAESRTLDEHSRQALQNLKARVLGGTPRLVPVVPGSRKSIIFTDGAYEPTSGKSPATVGGILYHYEQGSWSTFFFACAVPLSVVQNWEALGKGI